MREFFIFFMRKLYFISLQFKSEFALRREIMETALEIKGDVPIVGPSGEEKLNQELFALDFEEKEKKAKTLAIQTRQENMKTYAAHLREYNYQIKRIVAKK